MYALLAALLWGVTPILEKMGLRKAPPAVALSIRTISVAIALLVFIVASGTWREVVKQDAHTVGYLVAGGLCAALFGQLAYFYALRAGSPASVVPVAAAYPLIAAVLSIAIFKEPVTPGKVIGAILIVLGMISINKYG
jgi:transporter family protein